MSSNFAVSVPAVDNPATYMNRAIAADLRKLITEQGGRTRIGSPSARMATLAEVEVRGMHCGISTSFGDARLSQVVAVHTSAVSMVLRRSRSERPTSRMRSDSAGGNKGVTGNEAKVHNSGTAASPYNFASPRGTRLIGRTNVHARLAFVILSCRRFCKGESVLQEPLFASA